MDEDIHTGFRGRRLKPVTIISNEDRSAIRYSQTALLHQPRHTKLLEKISKMSQPRCQLLALLAELRTIIYHYVCTTNAPNIPGWDGRRFVAHRPVPPVGRQLGRKQGRNNLHILRTCKQILSEAETIYYSTNCIELYYHDIKKLNAIGLKRRSAINSIRVYGFECWDGLEQAFGKLQQHVPHLKTLHLSMHTFRESRSMDLLSPEESWLFMQFAVSRLGCLRVVKIVIPERTGEDYSELRALDASFQRIVNCARVTNIIIRAWQAGVKLRTIEEAHSDL
ncbi:hypothetical protein LTR37_002000 [Vermiconidia calcicola]|uniref:Uncharacterized protein n=1 Tax=Vermiconidia calcicola TaxID=1690605 RepID=A0ACC3NW81_9PEZI|nr:hypothetical protein LTR37_002000 [Vermiconidia calcicola]